MFSSICQRRAECCCPAYRMDVSVSRMCPVSAVERLKYITDINLEVTELHDDHCLLCTLFAVTDNVLPLDDYSNTVYSLARSTCTRRKEIRESEGDQIFLLVYRIFGKNIATTCNISGQITHYPLNLQEKEVSLDLDSKLTNIVDLLYHFKTKLVLEELHNLLKKELKPPTSFKFSDVDSVIRDLQKVKYQEKDGFDAEFSLLNMADRKYALTYNIGKANPDKNRYRNILPYDHSRVKLVKKKPEEDYINANYIFMENDEHFEELSKRGVSKLYIATQACMESTREDFWSMIWQERCHIIVTILNKKDASNERYWPREDTTEMYGRFTVKSLSQTKHQLYYKRKFTVSNCSPRLPTSTAPLTVYQYHIHVWNDNTVPESCDFLFKMLTDMDDELSKFKTSNSQLIEKVCVHCSAGIGRTGTFIAIDMAKDLIKNNADNAEIDIYKLVSIIRAQRPGLVRNIKQYKFIYYSLKEYYHILSKS